MVKLKQVNNYVLTQLEKSWIISRMYPVCEERASVWYECPQLLSNEVHESLGNLITSHILELDWTLPPSFLSTLISIRHILSQQWL